MGSVDSATWQGLGLLLTLLGLVFSALRWRRAGAVSGLRGVAWSLLPLAAGLTGLLRLGWEITDSVLSWAARLVFSPLVWLGLVVAAVSVVLFVVTGVMRRRAPRRTSKSSRAERAPASTTTASAGALPRTGSAAQSPGDDLADIEEILRKHGIT